MKKTDNKYDFCVVITTYNREEMLKLLLGDIFKYKKNYKILVIIFDDGSSEEYNLENYDVRYIKYTKNNGLKKLWKVIDDAFKICKKINADYFFYLQDDLRLKNNFFEESIRLFEKIPDKNKISLGTLMIESQKNQPKWTNVLPVEFDEYYKTQWVELVFVCKYDFFESLEFKMNSIDGSRWDKNPNLSSGVGEQISKRLFNLGLNMYHVINTLTTHGDHESKFFGEYRKKEKLIAL
jgi:glycosyltransferase involved in cell wall biosynthesis